MTTETVPSPRQSLELRASDAERERVVALLQRAGAEGRLTLAEVDERVAAAFAATYRKDLAPLTRDLPVDEEPRTPAFRERYVGGVPRGLVIHAVIAAVLSVMMITRWAASDAVFFWPAFPMLWLWGSLAIRIVMRRARGWDGPRWAGR